MAGKHRVCHQVVHMWSKTLGRRNRGKRYSGEMYAYSRRIFHTLMATTYPFYGIFHIHSRSSLAEENAVQFLRLINSEHGREDKSGSRGIDTPQEPGPIIVPGRGYGRN